MRPTIDYAPEVLAHLRSGWRLYRNNLHDRWRLARYKGARDGYWVKAETVEQLEREGKIVSDGPDEYRLNVEE